MNKEEIIKKHIEGWSGLQKASIDHFAESGKVSGSFFIALKSMLDEHANLQTEQLKKQLEEKEKELSELKAKHKEDVIKAYDKGNTTHSYPFDAEQYYTQTHGQ